MYIEFAFKPMRAIKIDQHKDDFYPNFTDSETTMTYDSLVIHKSVQDSVGVGVLWFFLVSVVDLFRINFYPYMVT